MGGDCGDERGSFQPRVFEKRRRERQAKSPGPTGHTLLYIILRPGERHVDHGIGYRHRIETGPDNPRICGWRSLKRPISRDRPNMADVLFSGDFSVSVAFTNFFFSLSLFLA